MRKRYKYAVYTKISAIENDWMFITKEREFKTKTEAIEYLIQRSEEDIEKYKLDLDDIIIDRLSFKNLKANSVTWIQSEEI